jgi:hypothetical protein
MGSLLSSLMASWIVARPLFAGMPAPLPSDVRTVLRMHDDPLMRLQAISFFLLCFVLCSVAIMLLWNYFRRDFPTLPRLSFGKSLAVVFLWGLLFVVVLTMISGARELMTPGAWKKQGFTYKLADDPAKNNGNSETVRRQHLEKLRMALWQFAALHNGRFPRDDESTAIAGELWEIPESSGLRYMYVAGLSADHAGLVLVCEPELDPEARFVLKTNGDILLMQSKDIQLPVAQARP